MSLLEQLLSILIVFTEPGFPTHGVPAKLPDIPGAVACATVKELDAKLRPGAVLVWRHGSTFPAEAWPSLVRFLEGGGSMLYLGGEPFTRPVTGKAGARTMQPRTVSLLKALRLNQCYVVDAGGAAITYGAETTFATPADARVAILEPRLADTKDFVHEDGAPGARDAILRPLGMLRHKNGGRDDKRFPFAAASYAIDHFRGAFAGGRWVFRLLSSAVSADELGLLLRHAQLAPVEFRVDPTFGCFHKGERPSLQVRVHRPRATKTKRLSGRLRVSAPGGANSSRLLVVEVGRHGSMQVPLDLGDDPLPGLYRVVATLGDRQPYETGFWIFDKKLFESGGKITLDRHTLRRNGVPEPIVGTTVMSRTVHRKFLFEPNAAVWDDTFGELASLDINLVRTGIWSAWRKISLQPNVVDEAFLRALEAYYLSARRHKIPVVFTFFAFLPETFGGKNPYLDPRAVEGQRAYVAAVAARFRNAKEILWDFINEPSFSNPKELWKCRPNGDLFEKKAFLKWLEEQYGKTWEETVRARWRLVPAQKIGLPTLKDFAERHVFEEHRPYRAREYSHFAQDAFAGWVKQMTAAVRQAGSSAAVTVGQDEGGLYDRPGPLLHHHTVDFTSMHTWWNNDALLWDGLLAKAPGKALLISETGIMQRERLSGEALRQPQDLAALLSRKIGYAFAAGAFGLIQWAYDVNPYLAIDNEAAIGLRRVDGSYKPEHEVLRTFAAFVARNRKHFDTPTEPRVVLVLPHGDHFSPRGLQARGTRRAVRILCEQMAVSVQVVSEYRTSEDLGSPRAILLPACRGISDRAWQDIQAAVANGAELLCSGWFEADDAGQAAVRIGALDAGAKPRALASVEPTSGGDLRYDAAITQSVYAARRLRAMRRFRVGKGRVVHSAVPIEWSQPSPAQRSLYDMVFAGFGSSITSAAGVLVRTIQFKQATLLVVVNERSRAAEIPLPKAFEPRLLVVPAGRTRMFLFDREHQLLDRSHN